VRSKVEAAPTTTAKTTVLAEAVEFAPDCPYISIARSAAPCFSVSGTSVIVASVNNRRLAIDTAFSSAIRTTESPRVLRRVFVLSQAAIA